MRQLHPLEIVPDVAPGVAAGLLGDALEQAFTAGAETLDDVVARLNEQGMLTSDGLPWTLETFQAEMSRLAAK